MSVSSVLYNNTVGELSEDFFLTTFHGINWIIFFPIYKEAWAKAYTTESIKAAFKVTGIFLLNPRVVLSQFSKPTANSCRESRANTTCILKYTPYTKYDTRQQTQFDLKYHFFTKANLTRTELQRLHQIKNIRPSKKDM